MADAVADAVANAVAGAGAAIPAMRVGARKKEKRATADQRIAMTALKIILKSKKKRPPAKRVAVAGAGAVVAGAGAVAA